MKTTTKVLLTVGVLIISLTGVLVRASAQSESSTNPSAIPYEVLIEARAQADVYTHCETLYRIGHNRLFNRWGLIVLECWPDEQTDPHVFAPTNTLFAVAQFSEGNWTVAVEGSEKYPSLVADAPEELLSTHAKQTLIDFVSSDGEEVQTASSSAGPYTLGLPWQEGTTWYYRQSIHGGNNALDFANACGTVGDIKATDAGVVDWKGDTCLVIRRSDGLRVGYQHVAKADVSQWSLGSAVQKGQQIGKTTLESGCSGYTQAHHVHLWLSDAGGNVNPNQSTFGGWKLEDPWLKKGPSSSYPHLGCVASNALYYEPSSPPSGTITVTPTLNMPGTCANGWGALYDNAGYFTANAETVAQHSNAAEWYPNITKSGTYRIEAYIGNRGTNFCGSTLNWDTSNAQYRIYHDVNKAVTVVIDQQPITNAWVTLGDFKCVVGTICYVRLTDHTGEPYLSRGVSFSNMRFTLLPDTPPPPPPTYSISGSITTAGGVGLGGVSVSVAGNTVQTASNGNYVVSGLPAGTHTVTPSKAEYTFSPGSKSIAVGPDASGVNFTANPVTYSIRGRVSDSANGSAVIGATVSAGGKTAQTDSSGNYSISGLAAGAYNVTVNKSGYSFTPTSRNVTLGPDANGTDFTGTTVTYSIKGKVTVGGIALNGVNVSAGGKSSQTDANGSFTIAGLGAGTYQVIPSKTGYTFNPGSRNVTIGPDATGIDFVGTTTPTNDTRMSINPLNQTVGLGSEQFCVQVRAENVTGLHAFEFTLGFPPSFLEGVDASVGPFLGSGGAQIVPLIEIKNDLGEVKFAAFTLGQHSGVSGNGDLATVCFMPEKAGTAALNLIEGKLVGANNTVIPATLNSGSVTISNCYFADFNCDNVVDISDVQEIAGRWGKRTGDPTFDPKYDLDGNGEIDISDVQKIASEWGWPNRQAPKSNRATTALTFSLDPADLDLKVGETRQIALRAADVENLGAFEVKLNYDAGLIQVNGIALDDFLGSTGRTVIPLGPDINNAAGEAHFGAVTIGAQAGVDGDGVLGWIEVTALAVGSGMIDLHDGRATTPDAGPIAVTSNNASYEISEGDVEEEYRVFLPAILNRP